MIEQISSILPKNYNLPIGPQKSVNEEAEIKHSDQKTTESPIKNQSEGIIFHWSLISLPKFSTKNYPKFGKENIEKTEKAEESPEIKSKPKGRTLEEDPEGLTNYEIPTSEKTPDKYKYIVLSGNYPQSVREVMKKRGNWTEIEDEAEALEKAHLMWRPCNYGTTGFEKLTRRK